MGAVRIYKEVIGDGYPWHARTEGCTYQDSNTCMNEHVDCNDYRTYQHLLDDLNDPYGLGQYLKK